MILPGSESYLAPLGAMRYVVREVPPDDPFTREEPTESAINPQRKIVNAA
jgi:hypothetical protein